MKINYLAIAACIFINMGLGIVWYTVFADAWMSGHGLTQAQLEANPSPMPYIMSVVAALAAGYVMSLLFKRLNVVGWQDGATVGAAIGSFMFFEVMASHLFSQKSLGLGALDGGYMFLLFVLYGALIGGWQKKE